MKKILYTSFCFYGSNEGQSSAMENSNVQNISQKNTQDIWLLKDYQSVINGFALFATIISIVLCVILIIMWSKLKDMWSELATIRNEFIELAGKVNRKFMELEEKIGVPDEESKEDVPNSIGGADQE